jgi:hypothetical protein
VVLAVVVASLVCAPTTASAKGPRDAVLRGPDVLNEGVAKLDQDQTMRLARAANLYDALEYAGPGSASRVPPREPMGRLGPKYVVTYNLLGGNNETFPVRQRLYPFAAGGPISQMPAGQRSCRHCPRTIAVWFDMKFDALEVLRDVGVPIPADRTNWPTARDDAHGLSISYPPSWHAAPSTLTPVLVDPIVPLAVGTAAMVPQKLGECDIVPQHAVEAVGRADALVAVYLYQGMASWSAKMDRPFAFGPDLPWHAGPVQCTEANPDVTVRTLNFSDGNARLSVLVVVGKDATPQRNAEVYAVLDSLRVG